ncbi:hypothetical protein B0A49_13074 [Lecanosticta acicola]|uniref:Thioredoxin domain-containing protein n=1 Tax=Lecanosticta acicola TaxID=111012 RepID=A0AAI9EFQ1_9PEZI|nr:hypothetical protein B0A49_13074 [Lecanosticta acicola]
MPHTELNSKSDFDKALDTKGKYVLIYAYENSVNPKADEYASSYASSTDAYKVDVAKHAAAREYFGVTTVPTIVVYKDGKEVKKVEGADQAGMEEVRNLLS